MGSLGVSASREVGPAVRRSGCEVERAAADARATSPVELVPESATEVVFARQNRRRTARFDDAEARLRALLWRHRPDLVFGTGLRILFTNNTCTLVSSSARGSGGTLRLHRLFAHAPDAILESIVLDFFTRVSPQRSRELRARVMDFVDRNRELALATTALPRLRPPAGKVYDLTALLERVVDAWIPERRENTSEALRIGWSRRATPSLMGKWIETPSDRPNLIAVNPLLDDARAPEFYLEYIVFHETLHDLFPIRRQGGRWVQHPVEFRRRERAFPRYEEARRWETEHLESLVIARGAR